MRVVMIAAPSHDGAVNVWHAAALAETCKIGIAREINVVPIYMAFDSLVQRARNDIVKLAIDTNVDDLVFIDTDQDWNPADFFKLLEHDVDVVGAPVPKKSDIETYNVKMVDKEYTKDNQGLVEVDSVGTGFMRLTSSALKKIWSVSPEYVEDTGKECRMVFDVCIKDGRLCSEDVSFCNKWTEQGGKIYIDPSINIAHSGEKRWIGNFEHWINSILPDSTKTSNYEEI